MCDTFTTSLESTINTNYRPESTTTNEINGTTSIIPTTMPIMTREGFQRHSSDPSLENRLHSILEKQNKVDSQKVSTLESVSDTIKPIFNVTVQVVNALKQLLLVSRVKFLTQPQHFQLLYELLFDQNNITNNNNNNDDDKTSNDTEWTIDREKLNQLLSMYDTIPNYELELRYGRLNGENKHFLGGVDIVFFNKILNEVTSYQHWTRVDQWYPMVDYFYYNESREELRTTCYPDRNINVQKSTSDYEMYHLKNRTRTQSNHESSGNITSNTNIPQHKLFSMYPEEFQNSIHSDLFQPIQSTTIQKNKHYSMDAKYTLISLNGKATPQIYNINPNEQWDIRVALAEEIQVPPEERPELVCPHRVRIKHRCSFYYAPSQSGESMWRFDFTLCWEGNNLSEAEIAQRNQHPKFEIEIELEKPWQYLFHQSKTELLADFITQTRQEILQQQQDQNAQSTSIWDKTYEERVEFIQHQTNKEGESLLARSRSSGQVVHSFLAKACDFLGKDRPFTFLPPFQ